MTAHGPDTLGRLSLKCEDREVPALCTQPEAAIMLTFIL